MRSVAFSTARFEYIRGARQAIKAAASSVFACNSFFRYARCFPKRSFFRALPRHVLRAGRKLSRFGSAAGAPCSAAASISWAGARCARGRRPWPSGQRPLNSRWSGCPSWHGDVRDYSVRLQDITRSQSINTHSLFSGTARPLRTTTWKLDSLSALSMAWNRRNPGKRSSETAN
jgi:hypothetical protein